uniref:Uncharacterized protein n=1 Tax=Anguilla anguilla TaxID=7936 RepID=A0A0E9X8U0_ANGAN
MWLSICHHMREVPVGIQNGCRNLHFVSLDRFIIRLAFLEIFLCCLYCVLSHHLSQLKICSKYAVSIRKTVVQRQWSTFTVSPNRWFLNAINWLVHLLKSMYCAKHW